MSTALLRRTLFGRHVGLFRDERGELHGIEVTCRHQNADLTLGERQGSLVICARHGWIYDLATGACLTESWARLRRYAVYEAEGAVFIDPTPLSEAAPLEGSPATTPGSERGSE